MQRESQRVVAVNGAVSGQRPFGDQMLLSARIDAVQVVHVALHNSRRGVSGAVFDVVVEFDRLDKRNVDRWFHMSVKSVASNYSSDLVKGTELLVLSHEPRATRSKCFFTSQLHDVLDSIREAKAAARAVVNANL